MAWEQADLDAIDVALKRAGPGPIRVRFPDGSEIERRTFDEMMKFRSFVAAQVAAVTPDAPSTTSFVVSTSKGIT